MCHVCVNLCRIKKEESLVFLKAVHHSLIWSLALTAQARASAITAGGHFCNHVGKTATTHLHEHVTPTIPSLLSKSRTGLGDSSSKTAKLSCHGGVVSPPALSLSFHSRVDGGCPAAELAKTKEDFVNRDWPPTHQQTNRPTVPSGHDLNCWP